MESEEKRETGCSSRIQEPKKERISSRAQDINFTADGEDSNCDYKSVKKIKKDLPIPLDTHTQTSRRSTPLLNKPNLLAPSPFLRQVQESVLPPVLIRNAPYPETTVSPFLGPSKPDLRMKKEPISNPACLVKEREKIPAHLPIHPILGPITKRPSPSWSPPPSPKVFRPFSSELDMVQSDGFSPTLTVGPTPTNHNSSCQTTPGLDTPVSTPRDLDNKQWCPPDLTPGQTPSSMSEPVHNLGQMSGLCQDDLSSFSGSTDSINSYNSTPTDEILFDPETCARMKENLRIMFGREDKEYAMTLKNLKYSQFPATEKELKGIVGDIIRSRGGCTWNVDIKYMFSERAQSEASSRGVVSEMSSTTPSPCLPSDDTTPRSISSENSTPRNCSPLTAAKILSYLQDDSWLRKND